MSTPLVDPTRPARRRGGPRRAPDAPPGVCRSCRAAPALPDEETCGPCGEAAIARARHGVESWLHMHADRVLDLARQEEERAAPA